MKPATGIEGIERYDRKQDRTQFDCGEEILNVWLKERASSSQRQDASRTYVSLEGNRVVGYHAISAYSLAPDNAPSAIRMGGYEIPAVLLGRLAVDLRRQGQGLGGILLVDAMLRAALISESLGARVMVVHALHDVAAAFYEKHGFLRFDSTPLHLYRLMKDVRLTLRAAGLQ